MRYGLIFLLFFSSVLLKGQESPLDALKTWQDHLSNNDVSAIENMLIGKNSDKDSRSIVARSMMTFYTNDFSDFFKTQGPNFGKYNLKAVSKYIVASVLRVNMPKFSDCMVDIEYDFAKNELFSPSNEDGNDYCRFEALKEDDEWHFWPKTFSRDKEVLKNQMFVFDLHDAFSQDSISIESALLELVEKYAQPSELEIKEQPLQGTWMGEEWTAKYGTLHKKNVFGKERYSARITNDNLDKSCAKWNELKGVQLLFSWEEVGDYDLTMDGMSLTVTDGIDDNQIFTEGKVTVEKASDGVYLLKVAIDDSGIRLNGVFGLTLCN